MRVLLDPRPDRHAAAFAAALAAANRRERGCLLTTVRGEASVQVTTEWLAEGRLETRTSRPAPARPENAVGGEDSRRFVVSSRPGEGRIEVLLSVPVNPRPLLVCLRRPVAYLGMIGSRRKVRMLREDWIRSGRATVEELDRVYAPIGLDLGAATVPEIACSIVAQLVAVRRRGVAARMPLEDSSR